MRRAEDLICDVSKLNAGWMTSRITTWMDTSQYLEAMIQFGSNDTGGLIALTWHGAQSNNVSRAKQ